MKILNSEWNQKDSNVKQSKLTSKSGRKQSITLSMFKDEIIRYCQTNLRPKTTEIYARSLRLLLEQLGDVVIRKIPPTSLENYKNIRSKNVGKTTVNMEVRTLRTIFGLAVKWGYITNSPAINLKQIKIADKEYLRFSKDELKKIVSFTKDEVFKMFILTAYYTGMRSSEICNLQWKDINIEANIIHVRNKNDFNTKTGKNRRIPLNMELKKQILQYLDSAKNFRVIQQEDYVFKNNNGTIFNKDIIAKRFKRIIRKAGLSEKFHFHCLRHSCLTDLVQSGVNVHNVKEIAGHSSIKTTENYLHASMEELYKSMNMLSINSYS